jgi:tetratricopeptide (TPR) repeat protein
VRVATPRELAAALPTLPGDRLSVIEFLDARSAEGLIRKYRVMMIGGQLYPAHAAISRDWKVHFFSSAPEDAAELRAEDQAFLENMERVLGGTTLAALRRIQQTLHLDYAGIDFSIGPNGELLVFEANATMNVQSPEGDEMWAYRRGPVQRIADAVRTLFFTKAFSRQSSGAPSPTHVLRDFTLQRIEDALAREPARTDLQIERARLLIEMERFEEAKDIYLEILTKDPTQFVALNNLGTLLRVMGFHKAALKVHREVATLIPDNVKARVNLANSLRESGELDEAAVHYEAVLRAVPDHAEAHRGLAYVLMYLRKTEAAWDHQKKGFKDQPAARHASPQKADLPRILLFSSPCGGNSPITRLLDQKTFHTTYIVPDFYDRTAPLPPHDLVLNAVGDADHCGTSLEAVAPLLQRTTKPLLNPPHRIQTTGRVENARLLGALEDVVTAKIATLDRDALAGTGGLSLLEEQGFTFPVLLRTPGFHEGSHFLRVEKPEDLPGAASHLPGHKLLAIQYLDARDADGKIRKYRVMMIGGKLYPLHKAISHEWMIHYFSAEMGDSPGHRAEDAAFLENMPAVLGPRAMAALGRIRDALGLDYAGADFSLGPRGEILLFEANATMADPTPEKGERWDFRRLPVQRIQAAVRDMILARAQADGCMDNPSV